MQFIKTITLLLALICLTACDKSVSLQTAPITQKNSTLNTTFEVGKTYHFHSKKANGRSTHQLSLTMDASGLVTVIPSEISLEPQHERTSQSTEDIFEKNGSDFVVKTTTEGYWIIPFDGSGIHALASGGVNDIQITCDCDEETELIQLESTGSCIGKASLKNGVYIHSCQKGSCSGYCDVLVTNGINTWNSTVLIIKAHDVQLK